MLRELSPEVMDHLLRSQFFGRLGCAADGQVLVVPVSYLYDGKAIYGQTHEGTKTDLLRQNPSVCFEIDEISSPSYWRSVVVQGVYEELQGDERLYAEQQLGPGRVPPLKASAMAEVVSDDSVAGLAPVATVVYRIRILSKTGRSETKEPAHINLSY